MIRVKGPGLRNEANEITGVVGGGQPSWWVNSEEIKESPGLGGAGGQPS